MKAHDQADRLVYSVPEAGRLLGLSRNAAYEAAKRGDIPTLRFGRLLRVPKIPFHADGRYFAYERGSPRQECAATGRRM